jgi:tetratricopeptide (TPR) repeat protein
MALAAVPAVASATETVPRIANSDGTAAGVVLETLAAPGRSAEWRAMTRSRRLVRARPHDMGLALGHVRRCVEGFRFEGDSRHLGHAEAALRPWWALEDPPSEVRLWRAIIQQSRHRFEEARQDLDTLVRERPEWAQAWLTRSTMLTVMGDLEGARASCQPLRNLAGDFVFSVADAGVASLMGEAEASRTRLQTLLVLSPGVGPERRSWALGILADICDRLGHFGEAEAHHRLSCALAPSDPAVLAAWTDFLFTQGRAREVADALRSHRWHHGLLLRWLVAKARLGEWDEGYMDGVISLRATELAAVARGETGHRREETIMHLELLDDADTALQCAVENWHSQREPADARLLLACALAARRPDAAAPVLEWRRRFRVEDIHLDRLVLKVRSLP